jgi:hypothetical protein
MVRCAVDFERRQVLVLDFERSPSTFREQRKRYLAYRLTKTGRKLVTEWYYEWKGFDDNVMEDIPNENTVQ